MYVPFAVSKKEMAGVHSLAISIGIAVQLLINMAI